MKGYALGEWLRCRESAKYANVSIRTFRMWLREKGLKHSQVGGLILIKTSDIDDFLDTFAKEHNKESDINQTVDEVLNGITK